MKTFYSIEEISEPFNKAVVTIGNFDGVHLGHQALFHEVIEKAEAIGGTSIAMTFEPHPMRVLKKKQLPAADYLDRAESRTDRSRRPGCADMLSLHPRICEADTPRIRGRYFDPQTRHGGDRCWPRLHLR